MRTVNLAEEPLDLAAVLHLASKEPVLLLTPDGKEFVLTEADDFEREVEGALEGARHFSNFWRSAQRISVGFHWRRSSARLSRELSNGEQVTIVAVGHKDHNRLFIRGQEVQL